MSKFYSEISKYYDDIFPVGDAQLNLIKEQVGEPPKNVLDIACGSGGYSKHLSDMGYQVTAIDLDDTMIKKLNEKNHRIQARVLNMLHIDKLNSNYDLMFCIGNSLVHLNDNDEILRFLNKCKARLNPGGKLIIQIVNYDRILSKEVKSLPPIENEDVGLKFERYYEYIEEQHKINFKTILKVEDSILENNVLLHPITSVELQKLLENTGFSSIKIYGNFKQEQYEPMDSFPLVVVAQI